MDLLNDKMSLKELDKYLDDVFDSNSGILNDVPSYKKKYGAQDIKKENKKNTIVELYGEFSDNPDYPKAFS